MGGSKWHAPKDFLICPQYFYKCIYRVKLVWMCFFNCFKMLSLHMEKRICHVESLQFK